MCTRLCVNTGSAVTFSCGSCWILIKLPTAVSHSSEISFRPILMVVLEFLAVNIKKKKKKRFQPRADYLRNIFSTRSHSYGSKQFSACETLN